MSVFFQDELNRFEFLAACSAPFVIQLCVFKFFLKGMPYSLGIILEVSGVLFGVVAVFIVGRLRNAGFGVVASVLFAYIFCVLLFYFTRWSKYFVNLSFVYVYGVVAYFSFFGGNGFWVDLKNLEIPAYVRCLFVIGAILLVWNMYILLFRFHMS
ncbi:hypothetical protein [Hydrogenophaga soli]